MQYYIKFFNDKTGDFVGYYKETGKNCVTAMPKGTKYFNTYEEAYNVLINYDGGFLRDRDKHYYTARCVMYCDSKREPKEATYLRKEYSEEEKQDAIDTIVRKSSSGDVQ